MKKSLFNQLSVLSAVSLLLIILSSCGTVAPFAERKQAQKDIDKAKTVEADLYQPNLFEASTTFFEQGESLIVTNKKDKKNNEAQTAYLLASTNAQKAYLAAVTPYTQKAIDETDNQIESARLDKVDRSSPDLFQQAVDLNRQAKDDLNQKFYTSSVSNALEARNPLQEAIAAQQEAKSQVNDYEQQVAALFQQADTVKSKNAVPNQFLDNVSTHREIQINNKDGEFNTSLETYPTLIESLKTMLDDTEAKRQLALKELSEANQVIDKIKDTSKDVDKEIENINKLDQPK